MRDVIKSLLRMAEKLFVATVVVGTTKFLVTGDLTPAQAVMMGINTILVAALLFLAIRLRK